MEVIHPEVLKILVCPVPECRAPLELCTGELACTGCGRRYRIEERWPVLLPEESRPPPAGP